jgi:hypothetical protein
MRSPWSVGVMMILFAGIAATNLGQPHPPLTGLQWALIALLIAGGGLMFIPRPFVRWIAIGVAAIVAIDGLIALKMPQYGLPVPPWMSIVIGFYLILRTLISKVQLKKPPAGGQFASRP